MISHKWTPIQLIEPDSENYDFSEIDSLHQQWLSIQEQSGGSAAEAHNAFLERLGRSWAIETGIIEGLYTLDRGITETLVKEGIIAEYIERSSTNKEPHDLVKILMDHQATIDLVYEHIRAGNPLTTFFIKELHIVLTKNQSTFDVVDQFENVFSTTLDSGGFKKLPNNPRRPDGDIHEYCPPVQVESELDNLLEWYNFYQESRYHPLLTCAWLHHRFAQIHPFQDGNGRVGRALLTWHLAKANFLPIVISRDDRDPYIEALELADGGELNSFVELIVQLEKRTILQALGEPEAVAESGLVDQVVGHLVEQIKRQSLDKENQMRSVNDKALTLRDALESNLSEKVADISERLIEAGMPMSYLLYKGGPNEKQHWYRVQIIETAKNAQHWANLNERRFFVKLALTPEGDTRNPRLVFVTSLHHTGNRLTGIMAATAFCQIEYYPDDNSDRAEESGGPHFRTCSVNPFTFTWKDDADGITPRFIKWNEECLSIALSYWKEFLT